jgi:uncharacterized membrane protein YphA (DoxX/SURF4 family)
MELNLHNLPVALLLLRITAGTLFFFQGYDKIFKVGIRQVVDTFNTPFQKIPLPQVMLKPMVLFSSYLELVFGLMLALGLFRELSLYLLAADLAAVAIAFSAMKAMWDMQFYFPRFVFVVFLLLLPSEADTYTLANLFGMK